MSSTATLSRRHLVAVDFDASVDEALATAMPQRSKNSKFRTIFHSIRHTSHFEIVPLSLELAVHENSFFCELMNFCVDFVTDDFLAYSRTLSFNNLIYDL